MGRLDTTDPISILSTFALAYDRNVDHAPDIESRSQLVRGILANKRALIILDHVRTSQEVTALLPPTGRCAVVLTTQERGLAIMRGARRFEIGPFDRDGQESWLLFAKILGEERATHERAAINELADFLGHSPLAIAMVAGQMASPLYPTAREVLVNLRPHSLEVLEGGESVHRSFNANYHQLSPEHQQFLAVLAVFGGEDFSVKAVAHVTQTTWNKTTTILDALVTLAFVRSTRPKRYQLIPMVRPYVAALSRDIVGRERMINFFLDFVDIHQKEFTRLDLEIGNILVALGQAVDMEMPQKVIQTINKLYPFSTLR